jgi:ribonuclease-3
MNVREQAVTALEARIGHRFADRDLLERALTHASAIQNKRNASDYQRLEFLGDRVLGLAVCAELLRRHPEASEKELTQQLHALTNGEACARHAEAIGVGAALRMAGGETKTGLRANDSVLGDVMEALLGAVYLDAGMEAAGAVVGRVWGPSLNAPPLSRAQSDPKTVLQEVAARLGRPLPRYEVVNRTGPDHAPEFTVSVTIEGFEPSTAKGRSRLVAEKAAALSLIEREQLA